MANPTSSEGECPHCGKEFDHLPAHQWQCPEKPDEDEENDVTDSDESENSGEGKADTTGDEDNDPEISDSSDDPENNESDSNAGVIVDKVKPQEKDTRKNKDESEPDQSEDQDDWVELDYNSGKQVKTIMETTDISKPRDAQKLLKAFKTGNQEDIPQFDEIRLSDGELR